MWNHVLDQFWFIHHSVNGRSSRVHCIVGYDVPVCMVDVGHAGMHIEAWRTVRTMHTMEIVRERMTQYKVEPEIVVSLISPERKRCIMTRSEGRKTETDFFSSPLWMSEQKNYLTLTTNKPSVRTTLRERVKNLCWSRSPVINSSWRSLFTNFIKNSLYPKWENKHSMYKKVLKVKYIVKLYRILIEFKLYKYRLNVLNNIILYYKYIFNM